MTTRALRLTAVALALATPALAPRLALAASAGPQPATTGAPAIGAEPAEQTCIACHNSSPLNPDADGTVTLEGVPAQYEAGKAYTLTLKVAHSNPAALRWGFQLTAIAMKDGAGAGELVVTDEATTMVLAAMSGTRSYIQHNYGGTAIGQAGGMSWSFEWKAPSADAGKVGFFAAVNVSNADGSNQGDRIYSQSPLPLAESSSAKG
jgi:mono/diheme cytochrome c family protein